jgi:hypothetical protein
VAIDGKDAWIVTPCQCLGDYRLQFFAGEKELITVTFHHQEFIRVEGRNGGIEFDLTAESGAKLRERLDSLVKKSANQTPQRSAIAARFSVCDDRSSRGSFGAFGETNYEI